MSGKAIRETLGFMAVVASLVFVGMEIRQNTAIARAQTRQFLTENHREWNMAMAGDPTLMEAFEARFPTGATGPVGDVRATYAMFAWLRHLENVFLQVQEGVVDASVLQSYGWVDQRQFYSAGFAPWWSDYRGRFNDDFVAAFEAEYDLAP